MISHKKIQIYTLNEMLLQMLNAWKIFQRMNSELINRFPARSFKLCQLHNFNKNFLKQLKYLNKSHSIKSENTKIKNY